MTDEQAIDEVRAVLDEFAARYSAKDADGALAAMAGDDIVLVGTGADEVRFGLAEARAQIERDMSQADELDFRFDDLRINVVGDTAFAFANVAFRGSAGEASFEMAARMTAGLVHTDDGWRFVQAHLSVPYADQPEGESFPE